MPKTPTPDSILEAFERMGGALSIFDRRDLLCMLDTLYTQGMEKGHEKGYYHGFSDGRAEEKARAKKEANDA